jgi:hypothetical protein
VHIVEHGRSSLYDKFEELEPRRSEAQQVLTVFFWSLRVVKGFLMDDL